MEPQIALVVPAWNEAESIAAVLAEVPRALIGCVVVVTGGPTDPTGAVAARLGALVVAQSRRGYGAACWAGACAAANLGAQTIVFLDGDYSDPPAEIGHVLHPILEGQADLVLGCRDLAAHPDALPRHAQWGNVLVLAALHLFLGGPSLRDLPSFKAIRVDQMVSLDMREMTYGWTVEMIAKARRANLRIAQVDVSYRPRLAGQSKVSGTWRGSLGAAWKLCTCAARYLAWTMPVRSELREVA